MNRFLPQLLSLHFYWYVQKLLIFVCDFTSCYSDGSICQLWLFWRNLHTFMVVFAFVCVYDVCAYVYSRSCVCESVCIHIEGTGWCRVSSSVALHFYILRHANAVLHGFWDSCMWALGTRPLVLMPSAVSTSARSHLSSPTLGSVICSIILSISRNNEHLKISFMF